VEEIRRHHPSSVDLYLDVLRTSVIVGSWSQIALLAEAGRQNGSCAVLEATAPPGPEGRPSDGRDLEFAQSLKGQAFDAEGLQVDQDEPRTMLLDFGAGH